MEQEIVNKVAQSQLITLNPADFFSDQIQTIDLKEYLFMEMILKEKDFRNALKEMDWEKFRDKNVSVFCSADAIIPLWAYMLVATYLQPYARKILYGTIEEAGRELFMAKISQTDFSRYIDKRIVLKGCGDAAIPAYAYVALTSALLPFAKSIMYGEPCSTVPVYKRKV